MATTTPHDTQLVKASTVEAGEHLKKNPINKRSGINRMSMALHNAPSYLTGGAVTDEKKHHKNPKNIISGVGYGGYAFMKGIATGIAGIVYEPYKGARDKGAKGAAVGVGKGLIGLVTKPVAGTVGLVGCTVQGAVNTPGTIRRATVKKGGKKGLEGEDFDEEEKKEEDVQYDDVGTVDAESYAGFDNMSMRTV